MERKRKWQKNEKMKRRGEMERKCRENEKMERK